MDEKIKDAKTIAEKLIDEHFSDCSIAILGGSIVRGEGTAHSDLDIFILSPSLLIPYRDSFYFGDYPVEAFVHNEASYKEFFQMDCERARPSLPMVVSEGLIIKDDGGASSIKEEAKALLKKGPKEWTPQELRTKRYFVTDLLDDFEGGDSKEELLFIAGLLAEMAHEFYLRTKCQWIGNGKWSFRALKRYDEAFAVQFYKAFAHFYKTGEKDTVIELVDQILEPYGGRLFDGYTMSK